MTNDSIIEEVVEDIEIIDLGLEEIIKQYDAEVESIKTWYDENCFGRGSDSCATALDDLRTDYCRRYPEFEEWLWS